MLSWAAGEEEGARCYTIAQEGELRSPENPRENSDFQTLTVDKAPLHACPCQSADFPDTEPCLARPGEQGCPLIGPNHSPPHKAVGFSYRLPAPNRGGRRQRDLGQLSPFRLDIWFLIGGLASGQHHEAGPCANVMGLVSGARRHRVGGD